MTRPVTPFAILRDLPVGARQERDVAKLPSEQKPEPALTRR